MDADVAVALVFGVAGVVISAVALLQTRKANEISKLALLQTEQAKTADHAARLIDRAASRLEAFEGISGSEDMALTQEYKTKHSREPGKYYEHFRLNCPNKIEVARSKLAKFWKVTIQLYEQKALPDNFFERGQWLRWGDRYRQLVEPLDVARYYRDGFFEDNGVEYDKAGNRPKQHRFLQTKWDDVKRPEEVVIDGMVWCVKIEKEIRPRLLEADSAV